MMTNLLGIDYGRSKIGVSIATTRIAEPIKTLKYTKEVVVVEQIRKLITEFKVEKIIVGVSEGKIAEDSKKFGIKLAIETGLPVEFSDETLSTQDAQKLSIRAGKRRKKRRDMEDAYAAAIMLQQFIDNRH